MAELLPFKFEELSTNSFLFVEDGGDSFIGTEASLERLTLNKLTETDEKFLRQIGWKIEANHSDLAYVATLRRVAARIASPETLNYLILVPTLRCDLNCTYCQVSRVNADMLGFDWTENQLSDVLRLLDQMKGDRIQIEFQGGEPSLRPDILERVMNSARAKFKNTRFVVCTNLSKLDAPLERLYAADDVFISTSLDGPTETHTRNRTRCSAITAQFHENLRKVIDLWGARKVSALPTIDYLNPPPPSDILDAYAAYGFFSIFLRPVNYQGFARKQHRTVRENAEAWNLYYTEFVREMLRRCAEHGEPWEEYYLSLAIRRALQSGHDSHVDFRNPSHLGADYLVVDFNGRLYPTDEARMLTRSGVVDLSIGDIASGVTDENSLRELNLSATNTFDPDCMHCAFQPACGSDPLDDVSRYGRVDLPRQETFFCQRQKALFKLAWQLILSRDSEVRAPLCRWLGIPFTEAELVPSID